jgi:hypothetical protein
MSAASSTTPARGRGRPPKAKAKAKSKPSAAAAEAEADAESDAEEAEEKKSEQKKQSKSSSKKQSSAKKKTKAQAADEAETDGAAVAVDDDHSPGLIFSFALFVAPGKSRAFEYYARCCVAFLKAVHTRWPRAYFIAHLGNALRLFIVLCSSVATDLRRMWFACGDVLRGAWQTQM